jgi:hypothetical protein
MLNGIVSIDGLDVFGLTEYDIPSAVMVYPCRNEIDRLPRDKFQEYVSWPC